VSVSADPDLAALVASAYTPHRGRRDQLVAMARAASAEPVAAAVAYQLPNPARSSGQLRAAAEETERRCAAVYADMVGSTSRAQRQWAIDALSDSAVRVLGFGAAPEPFPGVPEL
jgi:hypothetical protein